MTSAAVYGTGSWGTAFASVLADAGTTVTMWGRRAEVVEQINAGTNQDYLPELRGEPAPPIWSPSAAKADSKAEAKTEAKAEEPS